MRLAGERYLINVYGPDWDNPAFQVPKLGRELVDTIAAIKLRDRAGTIEWCQDDDLNSARAGTANRASAGATAWPSPP